MSVALNGFNADQIAPDVGGFQPWPGGWYKVVIVKSEEKPVKDKPNMAYLMFEVQCIEGPYQGKINYIRLNWKNESAKAVEIANGQLSALCHVVGVRQPPNTAALHNIPFQLSYKLDEKGNGGAGSNEANGFKDINGNAPGQQGGGQQNMQPQPQTQQYQQPTQPMQPDPNAGQGYGQPQTQPGGGWGNGQPQPGGQPQTGYGAPQPSGGWGDPSQGGGQPAQQPQQPQQPQPGWGAPGGQQPTQPAQQPAQNGGGWSPQPNAQPQNGGGWGGGQQ